MIDPKAIIEAAAPAAGLFTVVQAGNRDELNKLFESGDPGDYPAAAVWSWRMGIEPDRTGWVVWHSVDVLICDYSGFDDPGNLRYQRQQSLNEKAFNLFRLVASGNSWPAGTYPRNASVRALEMNMFDVNVDGVALTFEIPERQALCYTPPPPPEEEEEEGGEGGD